MWTNALTLSRLETFNEFLDPRSSRHVFLAERLRFPVEVFICLDECIDDEPSWATHSILGSTKHTPWVPSRATLVHSGDIHLYMFCLSYCMSIYWSIGNQCFILIAECRILFGLTCVRWRYAHFSSFIIRINYKNTVSFEKSSHLDVEGWCKLVRISYQKKYIYFFIKMICIFIE